MPCLIMVGSFKIADIFMNTIIRDCVHMLLCCAVTGGLNRNVGLT